MSLEPKKKAKEEKKEEKPRRVPLSVGSWDGFVLA